MKILNHRLFLFLTLLVCTVTRADSATNKYNVLFIAVDDLRPELGCYGQPLVKSPNIDALAKVSVQFNHAFCQYPLCNPTRSSLLTGRRPETLHVYNLETHFRDKNPDVVTLPQLFKQNGYESRSFGKIFHTGNGNHDDLLSWSKPPWHPHAKDPDDESKPKKAAKKKKAVDNAPVPDVHANELPYGSPDVPDEDVADGQSAAQAIATMAEIKDKPFFLAVGFYRPHLPYVSPKRYWDLYDPEKLKLAPNPFLPKDAPEFASNNASELRRYKGVPAKGPISDDEARKLIHAYYASISYVDAQIGKVLKALDQNHLREKTIIVLWGDHGYQLGEHGTWTKRTTWEIANHVPLLVSVPGIKESGQKSEALVEFVDIYPTLAELCKLDPPAGLEGTSFVPLLSDVKKPWKKAAFSIYQKPLPGMGSGFGRAMQTERYRFIEWKGKEGDKVVFELYDHFTDPQENVNIANLPENKELVAGLQNQLHQGWKAARP